MGTTKKPKKSDKTEYETIKDNIKKAFAFQKHADWKDDSERYVDYFHGKYYSSTTRRAKYTVNSIFNFINLIVPSLAGIRDLYIRVKSKKQYTDRKVGNNTLRIPTWRGAMIKETILNKKLSQIRFAQEVRKCVQDAIIYGFGVLKVGYYVDTESMPDPEAPGKDNDTPHVRSEDVFATRISPLKFAFDPKATSIDDSRYVVHELVKPLTELKKNDNYENVDDDNLVADQAEDKEKNPEYNVDADFATIYEYHDLETGKITLMPKNGKLPLRKPYENPYEFTGSHFCILKLAGDNDQFRGISMIGMIEDEAIGVNETVTKFMNHLEIFPGQVIMEEGALSDAMKQQWVDGEQGSLLEVSSGALREGKITKQPPIQMGPDYFGAINYLDRFMQTTLGIPDFQRPGGGRRKTATEATFEQSDASIRRQYFLGFVQDFIISAVQKLDAIMMQKYDSEDEVKIEGSWGTEFVTWSKEDIAGEYDYEFDVQSIQVRTQARAQQIINALNVLGANPIYQPILSKFDPEKLAKEVFSALDVDYEKLKKNPEVAHLDMDPNSENMLARQGKTIPDPTPFQNHIEHLHIHEPEMIINPSPELQRHIEMTKFILQSPDMMNMQVQPTGPIAPGMMGGGAQPTGPQPQASPAPTEPEMMGNFMSSLRGTGVQ